MRFISRNIKFQYFPSFYIYFMTLILVSCKETKIINQPLLLRAENFDTIIDNKKVQIFTLKNSSGCIAQFTNLGARWISMWVPDKTGRMTDVVLGFNNIRDYLTAGEKYHGAIVGRVRKNK